MLPRAGRPPGSSFSPPHLPAVCESPITLARVSRAGTVACGCWGQACCTRGPCHLPPSLFRDRRTDGPSSQRELLSSPHCQHRQWEGRQNWGHHPWAPPFPSPGPLPAGSGRARSHHDRKVPSCPYRPTLVFQKGICTLHHLQSLLGSPVSVTEPLSTPPPQPRASKPQGHPPRGLCCSPRSRGHRAPVSSTVLYLSPVPAVPGRAL